MIREVKKQVKKCYWLVNYVIEELRWQNGRISRNILIIHCVIEEKRGQVEEGY